MSFTHETEVFVRFCESDALGHVNNTSHFLYFEEGRTKFFHDIYPEKDPSLSYIIASITCDYLAEAFPGQTLKVRTMVGKVGTKSFTLEQTIENKVSDVIIAKGKTTIVTYSTEKAKSIPLPSQLRMNLEEIML